MAMVPEGEHTLLIGEVDGVIKLVKKYKKNLFILKLIVYLYR